MRIIVNAAFNVFAGVGITKYLQRLTEALNDKCDLVVLSPKSDAFADGIQTIKIPVWTARNYGRMLWAISGLRKHISAKSETVLLCPTPDTPPYPPIPTISVVHDLTPLILPQYQRLRDRLLFLAALRSLRWANTILADSRHTAHDLMRWSPRLADRISVCHNGPGIIDTGQTTGLARKYQPYLLYVGGFSPHKNLARLLKAFALLESYPDLKLVLVGGEHHRELGNLTLAAQKLDISNRVVILKNLSDTSVSELYKCAELFVYPSLYEGFGLPVLEALAHETPVACSYAASLPEVAGSLAVYFSPLSIEDMARTLEFALQHRRHLVENICISSQLLARFSWNTLAEQVVLLANMQFSARRNLMQ